MKTKRKLRARLVTIVCVALLVMLSIIKIPRLISTRKLEDLGYSAEAITAIRQRGLKNTIIKNSYYTDYLSQEIVKDDFKKEYLQLYLISEDVNDLKIERWERLKAIHNYSEEEFYEIYAKLNIYDMTALCVFNKLDDLNAFIEDAQKHPADKDGYYYHDDYLVYEENEISEKSTVDVLVNKQNSLGTYEPEKLAPVSSMNAVPNVYLESRALEAFDELCRTMRSQSMPIYAVSAYISYEDQKSAHLADNSLAQAGYNERQAGLSVSVVASENESASRFNETAAYSYLKEHAHEYGFIFRYGAKKEAVTGFPSSDNYLRFVGKELATEIYESGLSFEEYYALYLK